MPQNSLATPALVEMWRNNLRKSSQTSSTERPLAKTVPLLFHFGGGASALIAGQTGLLEIAMPYTLLQVHLFAGSALFVPTVLTATVDLSFGSHLNWAGGMVPMHAGVLPTMTAVSELLITDLTGWTTSFLPGDLIGARLATVSGTATFLLVVLLMRELPVKGVGAFDLVDFEDGDTLVDDDGNQIVYRQ